MSDDTDKRLRDGESRLRGDEWKGGDIPWLIELIAPFGAEAEILKDLEGSVFKGKSFYYHTVEGGQRVVKTHENQILNGCI